LQQLLVANLVQAGNVSNTIPDTTDDTSRFHSVGQVQSLGGFT
jgi:hypothetical protein